MIRAGVLALAALLPAPGSIRAEPVEAPSFSSAQRGQDGPSTSSGRTEVGTARGSREGPDAVIRRYHFAGEVLIARGDRVLLHRAYGTIAPSGGAAHRVGERWRLASITKQVTAMRVMQLVASGRAALDRPLTLGLTPRQLLTHHTGLADPDATAQAGSDFPAFYRAAAADLPYCRSHPAQPGAAFHYNNCDYLVLADALPLTGAWPAGMRMADAGGTGVPGFVGGEPEPAVNLATFGAAGGLIGTLQSVFAFDRELLAGRLLRPAARQALWTPEGNGSYQALGQWVFPGQLHGCAEPKRIVQRDGEIGGVQARNFILPDVDLTVIVFTNRGSDDFPMGEVWQRSGFAYDLLSAAACP